MTENTKRLIIGILAHSPDNAACERLSLGGMSPLNYRKSLGLVA